MADSSDDKIKLKWGQTPFDNLSREELLREVQRMFSALKSAKTVLSMAMLDNENSPYWDIGIALEKVNQVVNGIYDKFDRESVYRVFFRYANDLLFDTSKYNIGTGWSVCPICGMMIGSDIDGTRHDGKICKEVILGNSMCNGILRPLIWDDLKPESGK